MQPEADKDKGEQQDPGMESTKGGAETEVNTKGVPFCFETRHGNIKIAKFLAQGQLHLSDEKTKPVPSCKPGSEKTVPSREPGSEKSGHTVPSREPGREKTVSETVPPPTGG